MISIIIPVYNQAKKLGACLDSILGQSILEAGEKLETIVINDGSRDNIPEVIERYMPLFSAVGIDLIFKSQENRGANAARNAGEREAHGEYVIFCDADIEMHPAMLEKMSVALKTDTQASYAYSSFIWGAKLFKLFPFDAEKLKAMPYIHTTTLMRRIDFPGFDEGVKRLQDWDLWLTMLEAGKTGVWTGETLFRVKTGGTMSNWLPSLVYKLLPFLPAVKRYDSAVKAIKAKHRLG